MSFAGKVVFVTGASSGIGKQVALDFAKAGASVVITARTEENLKAATEEIGKATSPDKIAYFVADSSIEKNVENAIKFTVDKFGSLDIAFNNSGTGSVGKIHETTEEVFDGMFAANAKGTFLAMKHEIKLFLEKDIKGIILNK